MNNENYTEIFTRVFTTLFIKLDLYFFNHLKKFHDPDELMDIKKELISETAAQSWMIFTGKQNRRIQPLSSIIMDCASIVWAKHLEQKMNSSHADWIDNIITETVTTNDFFQDELENKDQLERLRKHFHISDINWKIFMLHLEGYGYKEIAAMMSFSADAVKQRAHRIMQNIARGLDEFKRI